MNYVINKSSSVKFAVLPETAVQHFMSVERWCGLDEDSVIFKTDVLYSFEGSFLFAESVDSQTRRQMDSQISQFKYNGTMNKIYEKYARDIPPNCYASSPSAISAITVIFPIVIVIGPSLLLSVTIVLRQAMRRSKVSLEEDMEECIENGIPETDMQGTNAGTFSYQHVCPFVGTGTNLEQQYTRC